jgi:hypothetical protein
LEELTEEPVEESIEELAEFTELLKPTAVVTVS